MAFMTEQRVVAWCPTRSWRVPLSAFVAVCAVCGVCESWCLALALGGLFCCFVAAENGTGTGGF